MTKTTVTKAKKKKKVKQYGNGISLDLLSAKATIVHTLSEGVLTVAFCKHSREGERIIKRESERKLHTFNYKFPDNRRFGE